MTITHRNAGYEGLKLGEANPNFSVSLGIILRDYLADILRDRRLAIFS